VLLYIIATWGELATPLLALLCAGGFIVAMYLYAYK
jgi:hypothetical protein